MRPPRLRFTVRRMMTLVAASAIALGCWLEVSRLRRVSAARRRDAASYAASEALARKFAQQSSQRRQEFLEEAERLRRSDSPFASEMERVASRLADQSSSYRRNAAHWAMMHKKYERAARSPWFSLAPDPPPP
jgi:hypothetical protein